MKSNTNSRHTHRSENGIIRPDDVCVAEFSEQDIQPFLDYWYRSPVGFMQAMGVDVTKLPSEPRLRELLQLLVAAKRPRSPVRAAIVSIRYRGKTIGVHELTHLIPQTSGLMHAHIWDQRYRGAGIGPFAYVAAMQLFFERFGLWEIRFETPVENRSAQRVKAKLGISPCGEGLLDMPMLREPLRTVSYRVLRSDMDNIRNRLESENSKHVSPCETV